MMEPEWNICTDPQPMLEFLRGKVSDRKLRLFAVACCRQIWHLVTDERSRCYVDVIERQVDGLTTEAEVTTAADAASNAVIEMHSNAPPAAFVAQWFAAKAITFDGPANLAWSAGGAVVLKGVKTEGSAWERTLRRVWMKLRGSLDQFDRSEAEFALGWDGLVHLEGWATERATQASLLRDIMGNRWPLTKAHAAWLTQAVKHLAHAIYEQRAFDRMPILADALEEAGCTNEEILKHCRSGGEHVRGCWVVDLILGKE